MGSTRSAETLECNARVQANQRRPAPKSVRSLSTIDVDSSIIVPSCAPSRGKARVLASRIALSNRLTGARRRMRSKQKQGQLRKTVSSPPHGEMQTTPIGAD
jgi:hypothetical protein